MSQALPEGYGLRALDGEDAPELHALIERNRARLARWIHWAEGQTAADTLAFIARANAMEQDGRGFSRAIVTPCGELSVSLLGYSVLTW